jgi:hypothetical protein
MVSAKPKDRPIIFSAPMVRALLAGRKTQTRRILKPQPLAVAKATHMVKVGACTRTGRAVWEAHDDRGPIEGAFPAGQHCLESNAFTINVGDLLWVRENWRPCAWDEDGDFRVHYPADDARSEWLILNDGDAAQSLIERVCDELDRKGADMTEAGHYASADALRVRPSIHMPRWASRLTLRVSSVKVERLQDISEADAVAEGIGDLGAAIDDGTVSETTGETATETGRRLRWASRLYAQLWDDINGNGAWDANPWVVAVTFSVIKANIDNIALEALAG